MKNQQVPPKLTALPFHLMLGLSGLMSSTIAFECFRQGLSGLREPSPTLQNPELLENLSSALQNEALARAESFLTGLQNYFHAPYTRDLTEPAAVWHCGSARLLDYSLLADTTLPPDAPVVLFIPSLINRYYILDLEKQRSLARFLTHAGCHVLMLDWQSPGDTEALYSCDDYIRKTLFPCLDFICGTSGRAPIVAGYCMGGVLALALAQLKPKQVSALALLATPWDFHSPDFKQIKLDEFHLAQFDDYLAQQPLIPAEQIQALFYLSDPWLFQAKFQRFAKLSAVSHERRKFIALEAWVNDGVPMTSPAARECIIGWAQCNVLARNQWKVAGRIIRPQAVTCPAFIAIPRNDSIVPAGCARPLAVGLPHATLVEPSSGHVSMIVGKHARAELWEPLKDWLLLHRSNESP